MDCFSTSSFNLVTARLCLRNFHLSTANSGHDVNNKRESKMSDNEVESNSLIKCDVCLNDYGQSRQQKFLPCLHSFCQSCLTEIQQVNGEIKCPICRELHVDSRDVSSLPSNYFEAMKKMEGEKNKIISLYKEMDELKSARIQIKSARIQKLEHDQAQDFEIYVNLVIQLSKVNERLTNEHQDEKSKMKVLLEQLARIISEQKLVIQKLEEQVASLEDEKH